MPLPITHIYEVVDATNEEAYLSMGFYIDKQAAIERLDVAAPPCLEDFGEDRVTFEVRKHAIGWNQQKWDVVAKRAWERIWPEAPGDGTWICEPPRPHQFT